MKPRYCFAWLVVSMVWVWLGCSHAGLWNDSNAPGKSPVVALLERLGFPPGELLSLEKQSSSGADALKALLALPWSLAWKVTKVAGLEVALSVEAPPPPARAATPAVAVGASSVPAPAGTWVTVAGTHRAFASGAAAVYPDVLEVNPGAGHSAATRSADMLNSTMLSLAARTRPAPDNLAADSPLSAADFQGGAGSSSAKWAAPLANSSKTTTPPADVATLKTTTPSNLTPPDLASLGHKIPRPKAYAFPSAAASPSSAQSSGSAGDASPPPPPAATAEPFGAPAPLPPLSPPTLASTVPVPMARRHHHHHVLPAPKVAPEDNLGPDENAAAE